LRTTRTRLAYLYTLSAGLLNASPGRARPARGMRRPSPPAQHLRVAYRGSNPGETQDIHNSDASSGSAESEKKAHSTGSPERKPEFELLLQAADAITKAVRERFIGFNKPWLEGHHQHRKPPSMPLFQTAAPLIEAKVGTSKSSSES